MAAACQQALTAFLTGAAPCTQDVTGAVESSQVSLLREVPEDPFCLKMHADRIQQLNASHEKEAAAKIADKTATEVAELLGQAGGAAAAASDGLMDTSRGDSSEGRPDTGHILMHCQSADKDKKAADMEAGKKSVLGGLRRAFIRSDSEVDEVRTPPKWQCKL